MVNKYFKAYKKGKEIVETLKGTGKKTKGYMATDPHERKGIAKGLKEHRKSKSHKIFKETMKKLDKHPDLSYLKGHFSKD